MNVWIDGFKALLIRDEKKKKHGKRFTPVSFLFAL